MGRKRSDQEKNLQEQAPKHPQTIPLIHSMPSMIREDDDEEDDDALEEVSLDSFGEVNKVQTHKSNSNTIYAPPKDPMKSKTFSVKKMFGRKKK